jgi:hypothetical protein
MIERVVLTNGFSGQTGNSTKAYCAPVTSQAEIGCTTPVGLIFAKSVVWRTGITDRSIIQVKASFQLEGSLQTTTQIFRAFKADSVIEVGAHTPGTACLLDITSVNNTINGDVGLGMRYAGSSAEYSQCN